jgi:hypothetical protein
MSVVRTAPGVNRLGPRWAGGEESQARGEIGSHFPSPGSFLAGVPGARSARRASAAGPELREDWLQNAKETERS